MKKSLPYQIAIGALIIITVLYFCVLLYGLNILHITKRAVNLSVEHVGCNPKLTPLGATGDTIGGIFSPFISIIASLLTYWAFKEQVDTNKIQFDELNLGKFETRFNLLLSQHRENIEKFDSKDNQSTISTIKSMLDDFKLIYVIISGKVRDEPSSGTESEYYEEDIAKISMAILLFGFESVLDSRDEFSIIIKGKALSAYVKAILELVDITTKPAPTLTIEYYKTTDEKKTSLEYNKSGKLRHGYGRILENYLISFEALFNHIYWKWEDETRPELKSKYAESFNVLESQLTSDELLLLLYYSISNFSESFKLGFTKSGLINHVPLYSVDFLPVENLSTNSSVLRLGRYSNVFKNK